MIPAIEAGIMLQLEAINVYVRQLLAVNRSAENVR